MKKLLMEFVECGWMEPSDSEWASPAFIVPKNTKGEWRPVVYYWGLKEQAGHDSYSLSLIDSILQKQQKKHIFASAYQMVDTMVVRRQHRNHEIVPYVDGPSSRSHWPHRSLPQVYICGGKAIRFVELVA